MAATLSAIDDELAAWLQEQPVFFVASAARDGRVNVSPKGYDTFRVLDEHTVAYLDLTGSGVETIAHIRENGRVTVMFCAFSGNPKIIRLYGTGRSLLLGTPEYDELAPMFPRLPGARAVITVAVDRISSSCGYSVPMMGLVGERDRLLSWERAKGEDALVEYRANKNAQSIDGLPGYGE
jgi:Pyridoxamine 5'-phosphate oxidase